MYKVLLGEIMRMGAQRLQFFWSLLTFSGIIASIIGAILLTQDISFLGLTSFELFIIAGFCLPVGVTFAFPLASHDTKDAVWYFRYIWLLFFLISVIGGIYSLYLGMSEAPNNVLELGDITLSWGALASIFLMFGLISQVLLLFSMTSISTSFKNLISKLGLVWLLLSIIGIIVSLMGYYAFTNTSETPGEFMSISWEIFVMSALFIGITAIPFLIVSNDQKTVELTRKLSLLWLLVFFIGVGIVGQAAFEYLNYETVTDLWQFPALIYHEKLAITGIAPIFLGLGLLLPHQSEEVQEIIAKLQIVWVLLAVFSTLIVITGGAISAGFIGGEELDNFWNIMDYYVTGLDLYLLGLIMTMISCAFITRVLYTESGGFYVDAIKANLDDIMTEDIDVDEYTAVELTHKEKKSLIVVKKESAIYTLGLLKSAYRRKEVSKNTYARWRKNMSKKIIEYNDQLAELRKKTKLVDQTSLFTDIVSDKKPAAKAKQKPISQRIATTSVPPATQPQTRTPPPPTVAARPPSAPTMPPAPTPISPTMPPAPTPQAPSPAPIKQTNGAVGTARSTSIAELRGEMLKELQRLKDIFDEEE